MSPYKDKDFNERLSAAANARKEEAVAAALAELRYGEVYWVDDSVHDVTYK